MSRSNLAARCLAASKSLALTAAVFLAQGLIQAQAQQVLVNGGFEAVQQPAFGNNINPAPNISPWVLGVGSGANVVRVDGPGGTVYNGGGPQVDATGLTATRHYLDINMGGNQIRQAFTAPCNGTVTFRGFFSSRLQGSLALNGNGSIAIRQGDSFTGPLVATTPVTNYTSANWAASQATATVTQGQTYSFVVTMDNNLNFDEGTVTYESACTPTPTADPCCPPWNEQVLQSSLAYQGTTIAAPYTLTWQPPSTLNTQMQAYINYLHAMDPTITNITIAFGLFDAGTGAAPVTGVQVAGTQNYLITWTAGANMPTGTSNFLPPGVMLVNRWYTVATTIFLNDGKVFFGEGCAQNAMSMRLQVTPGVAAQGGGNLRSSRPPLEFRAAPRQMGPAAPARRLPSPARR